MSMLVEDFADSARQVFQQVGLAHETDGTIGKEVLHVLLFNIAAGQQHPHVGVCLLQQRNASWAFMTGMTMSRRTRSMAPGLLL